ncbi:hypothetical protein OG21DRAFT_1519960 [Imleria badia]|nr:hypothetical protein OG21DRAFT_1519960 [Imleria badia]
MFAMVVEGNQETTMINEVSPSNDEHFAESVLRREDAPETQSQDRIASATQGTNPTDYNQHEHPNFNAMDSQWGWVPSLASHSIEDVVAQHQHNYEVEDVVAQHHQRNRVPPLPTNTQLLAVCDKQQAQCSHSATCTSIAANDTNDLNHDVPVSTSVQPPTAPPSTSTTSIKPPPQASLPHVASKQSKNANPSQLHFYPLAIRDVIECAKQISHCNLASINSFPLCPHLNAKSSNYVNEAIAERHNRGLAIPTGWWPNHLDDIAKLLWEDIENWWSGLKKRARVFIQEWYEWDPENRCSVNTNIAKNLLNGSAFLKYGLDDSGHMNNLAHPALSGVIVDFFYTGQGSIGNLFPEVFTQEVPRPTVALAATAIKVALNEIAAESKDISFKCDVYADVYINILGLMSKCNTSPIHCAKTKTLRIQWVKIGRNGNSMGTTTGFDVDLD